MRGSTNVSIEEADAPTEESELIRVLKSEIRRRHAVKYHTASLLPKTGVVLLNFGGPWTLADVKPFLYRLFSNPSVLVGVTAAVRQLLAFTIAQVKGPSSIKAYESIGGGSLQLMWTETQADGLRRLLKNGESERVRVEIGMRSAEPSIERALRNLKDWGAQRLVLLPMFPHFSTTTTGACLQEAPDSLPRLGWKTVTHAK